MFNQLDAFTRKVFVGTAAALTCTLAYAVCPPQYVTELVEPMFESSKQGLNEALQAVDEALSEELEEYSERINSAVAVLTKQKAVAANQIGDATRSSAQMTAASLNVLAQTERVKQARFEHGGEFGQGFSPCAVYNGRNLMANREADLGEERRHRMVSEVQAGPGRFGNPAETMLVQAKDHRDNYCTQDQVNAGMCAQVGALAGASLRASTLFEPAMESDNLYKAKVAFVNNVVGLPDAPVPSAAANTPAAAAYSLAKAQKDALLSPALTSLKEVQLEHTGIDSAHSGSDIPQSVRLNREVQRYLGDAPEHEAWTKAMVGQNSRGLMVEMLKVKALDLVLLEKQYRQYERMEANLATLVASEMRKQASRAAVAADAATTQNVKSQIQ